MVKSPVFETGIVEGSKPSSPAKKCTICKTFKSLKDFYTNQNKCKDCSRVYMKFYYRDNPEKRTKHINSRKIRIRREVNEYKESRGCTDCGGKFPAYVLQFDHLYDKKFTISTFITNIGVKRLWDEIAKCDVVCANCHAIRTHQRLQVV